MATEITATIAVQQPVDVSGMDLETAMMAVQSNRANLLEAQLKDQVAEVQRKNDKIATMNALLGKLNGLAAKFDSGAKASDKVSVDDWKAFEAAAKDANIALPPEMQGGQDPEWEATRGDGTKFKLTTQAQKDEAQHFKNMNWAYGSSDYSGRMGLTSITETKPKITPQIEKGKLDAAIQTMKSQIDGLSNSQQMDMLRLQSLSNKRNEAFEIMTNFMKKQADNRSSIVGNMR